MKSFIHLGMLFVLTFSNNLVSAQTHYYLMQGAGNPLLNTQWTTDPTGALSVAPPANLQVANAIFHFTNRATATVAGNFVTKTTAPNPGTVIIESGFNLSLSNPFGKMTTRFLDLASTGTLTIKNASTPTHTFNSIDVNSAVVYDIISTTASTVAPASYGNLVIARTATLVTNTNANAVTISASQILDLNSNGLIISGAGPLVSGPGTFSGNGTSFIECYGGNGGDNGTFNFTPNANNLDYFYIQLNSSSDFVSLGSDLNINFSSVGAFYQLIGSFKLNGNSLVLDASSDFGPPSVGLGEIYGGGNSSIFINGSVGLYSATNELYMNSSSNSLNVLLLGSASCSLDAGNTLLINDSLAIQGGGIFNTNGNVTLVSTSTLKGRLGNMSNGTLNGNLTVQTFARGNTTDWANLGVSGIQSQTFNNWYGQIPMAIEGSTTGVTSVANTYFESVQSWFESSDSYDTTLTVTSPITPGKGYWIYLGTSLFTTTDMVWSVSGTPVTGNVSIPVTNSGAGWNLISNPYPSPVDWSNVMGVAGNSALVNDAYYIYDAELGNTVSYVSGVATPASYQTMTNVIPMGQAFYVEAIGAGNLTVQENCKSDQNTNANELLKSSNAISSLFRLNIDGGGYHDDAVLRFHSNATNSFDKALDARKMYNSPGYAGYPGAWGKRTVIATQSNNEDYSINSLPYAQTQNAVIPVIARVYTTGQYTISGTDIQNLPPNACVILKDKLLNVTQDLRLGNYICNIIDTTIASRFELTICADITADVKSNTAVQAASSIAINKDSQGIFVDFDFSKTTNANIIVTNVLGQIIMDTKKVKVTNDNVYLDLNVNDQLIFVTVETDNEKVTKKFLNFR